MGSRRYAAQDVSQRCHQNGGSGRSGTCGGCRRAAQTPAGTFKCSSNEDSTCPFRMPITSCKPIYQPLLARRFFMRLIRTAAFVLTQTMAFSAFLVAQGAAQDAAQRPVQLDSGKVTGAVSDGVRSYKGIPFAAPPVGNLRWREPQPPTPWRDVRAATQYGHDCMQQPIPSDAAPLGTAPAEDCLVMNVWVP